jgi:phospholipid/cholesterol/gamma-HCH transport system substrate-binding protein
VSTLTREGPRSAAASPPPPPKATRPGARSPWRLPALLALALAIGAVVYIATRGSSYRYRFDFADAGQLVAGDLVRIGGTPAGTITNIALTANGQARLTVSIDSQFGPLRQGTTATIRAQSLVGVASRYIDVSPGPSFAAPLPAGGVLPASKTSGIVDIDELFDALDGGTRQGLQRVIRGFADWYAGKSAQANLSAQYFPAALQAYTRLFSQIDADTPTLTQFIARTSVALGAIGAHSTELTDLVSQAGTTVSALASENRALSQALVNLPGALRAGSGTFRRLRFSTLPALSQLVAATQPVTAPLGPFLDRLQPVLGEAVPTFARLVQVLDRPGPSNDLLDALHDLPALAAAVSGDFPRAIRALNQSTPIFEFVRPYVPDLVGWVSGWDGLFAPYDANGHYGRTVPVFDAFTLQGGVLSPKPPNLRGSGGALRTGFTERCPGGAIAPPTDHSAPFVDSGPLSNAHCRPSETIGGTP